MMEAEIIEVMAAGEHNHIQIEMRRLGREADPDWEAMSEDYKVGARKAASFILAALRAHGMEVVSVADLTLLIERTSPNAPPQAMSDRKVLSWVHGKLRLLRDRAMITAATPTAGK